MSAGFTCITLALAVYVHISLKGERFSVVVQAEGGDQVSLTLSFCDSSKKLVDHFITMVLEKFSGLTKMFEKFGNFQDNITSSYDK